MQPPAVMLYGIEPGPNETLPDAPWDLGRALAPQTNTVEADLRRFLRRPAADAKGYVIGVKQGEATDGSPKGSEHIARLWARDRVLELMRTNAAPPRRGRDTGEPLSLVTR
jgi:hypothetical protein